MDYRFEEPEFESNKRRGAGGTPGGLIEFFIGLIMSVAGAYLVTNQVTVTSSFRSIYGYNAFGLTLVPLPFGIGVLFFNGKSIFSRRAFSTRP